VRRFRCSCRGQGYLESYEENREERRKELTAAHRTIARLSLKGHVRVLVTANFDGLLERALEVEGITPIVIDTPDAAECTSPMPHSGCTIVKVNGDYLETVQRIRQRSSASTITTLMRCSGASSSVISPRSSPPQIDDSTHFRGERVTRHRWNRASSKPLSCASNGSRIN
jgi:NAD-dependent SIR2 family protein deacetylase